MANPNHDDRGRFASGGSSTSAGSRARSIVELSKLGAKFPKGATTERLADFASIARAVRISEHAARADAQMSRAGIRVRHRK